MTDSERQYQRLYRIRNAEKYREHNKKQTQKNLEKRKTDRNEWIKANDYQNKWNEVNREFVRYRNKCYTMGVKPISVIQWRIENDS